MKKRIPAVAGVFYPASPLSLQEMIENFLEKVGDIPEIENLKALIVPHAALFYSGQVAAYAYKILAAHKKKKVVLLGPSHTVFLDDAVCDDHDIWETPLGTVSILENPFRKSGIAHRSEHCLEVQIPFLQKILDEFEIVPLVVGAANPQEVAASIEVILDDETLLVVSSDLSHFNSYDTAVMRDHATIKAIEDVDYDAMLSIGDACGKIPLLTLIDIARRRRWRPCFLAYANSGDITGDRDSVVGYASFVLSS